MNTVQIRTAQGILEGEQRENLMIFRGVPYAKPPVNELRWHAPQPAEAWDGVRSALSFGPAAPQPDMAANPFYGKEFYTDPRYPLPEQSEDCLYLNIWAPPVSEEKKYPVAVWIHGSAFDHGFGHEMEFDGEAYAREGVILVTINYRVGILGFLALPELAEQDEHHSTGNYGILDQIQALKWVQENIGAFGGDPGQVTVFGQSAGAISTQTLLSSPLCKGLFHRAIMQSGAGYHNNLTSARTMDHAGHVSLLAMKLLGAETLDDMYRMPAEKFVEILPELYKHIGGLAFRPTIDGYVLDEDLNEVIRHDRQMPVPVMIGTTADDITVDPKRDAQDGPLYLGCINFAFVHPSQTYVYYFTHRLPGDDAGAFHSSELWYTFGTLNRCWRPMTPHDSLLSWRIIGYWTSFMKTGIPDYYWPACNHEQKIPYIKTLE